MKKITSLLLAVFCFTASFGQTENGTDKPLPAKKKIPCSKLYIDLSTGINNNASLLGGGIDWHLSNDFSLNAGLGIASTWGYKFYLGGKCYFKPCHLGWAIGGGATFNTGIPEYNTKMETIAGADQPVTLNLLPQANIFAAAYKHWRLGKNKSRMYLQLGLSKAVTNEKFRQVSGSPLTNTSASVMKFLAPGGLVIGLGFSFAGK